MEFDFETPIDRRGTGADKWDRNSATHGLAAPGEAFAGEEARLGLQLQAPAFAESRLLRASELLESLLSA